MKGIESLKKLFFLILIIWFASLVPVSADSTTEKPVETIILQLKWFHQFQFAGYYAAIEKKYYADAGLKVILKEGRPGVNYSDEVISKNADYGIEMPILLLERHQGKPVVVLAAIFQHSPEIMLSRKDSGITSPHDLIGKKIMLRPHGNIESRAMFYNEGIPVEKLNIINHSWNISDLIDKNVDAFSGYITDRPFMLQEREVPYNIIRPLTYGVDFYGDCLFTTQKEIDKHPQRVKAFLDASIKGWNYAMNHPVEIVNLILKQYSTRLSKEALLFEADAMQELLQPKFIEIGHINPGRWKHIADTFVKLKMLSPAYSLEGFLYDPTPVSDYDKVIKIVWILVGVVLLIILSAMILFLFNRKLANQVSDRTAHLSLEIKERKQTEAALQESEKKYRQLFMNAPAGIYEIDFEKIRFTSVNDIMCKYSGYSEKEFLSMNPMDLLTEDSKNLYIERLEKMSAGEKLSDTVEYNVMTKNGQEVCVLLSNDYIYKNRKLAGARVVAHNITDRKKAEEEKIKAQKIAGEHKKLALVGQIAGKMAHDFNNILGIIMGNAELSFLDCKDKETKKTLKLIFEQTIRGKNLTKNLVAFAKDQEPKQEFFRINEKIDLVLSLLKKDLEGIELIKEDKPGVPELLADPGMIEHALVNIIQNSIHAISLSEHPRIMIKTYCLDDNICFEIEDNGCGIAQEHLEKIYEPSFTLKGSKDVSGAYKSGIKGTGYGMSNVKKYIELHKGTLAVESEFGSGTKFIISLPVIKKELTRKEKTELQEQKINFDKYILLVEDEQAISGVQYRILSQEPCNHRVDIANNGQVAIDLFKRNKYDLVSLDYILPGEINGMDVYHHIRETNKTIPILFISGNIEFLESLKELKQKDNNIDHLSKPCQNKDYVNGINGLFKETTRPSRDH